MDEWTPAERRPARSSSGRILEPLAPFSESADDRQRRREPSCVRARCTRSRPGHGCPGCRRASAAIGDASERSTADQMAAEYIGRDTPLPSICSSPRKSPTKIGAGIWEGSTTKATAATISFRRVACPCRWNPARARSSTTLFKRAGRRTTPASARAAGRPAFSICVAAERRELADAARASRPRRARRLPGNRPRRRAACGEGRDDACWTGESPDEVERRFVERLTLMFDLTALAFRADITRVASLMMAAEASSMTYGHLGVPGFIPSAVASPERSREDRAARPHPDVSHAACSRTFVRKLAELPDGDGSILDRSLILFGSNMSDSHAHDHFPLPLAMIGGGCGTLRGGPASALPDRTPIVEPAAHDAASRRCAGAVDRRQHGRVQGSLDSFRGHQSPHKTPKQAINRTGPGASSDSSGQVELIWPSGTSRSPRWVR